MDRLRTPTEFGFATSPFIPPEYPRPVWKTLVGGALLALIPFVGAGISAVFIDRRSIPGTFELGAACKTALIQLVAVAATIALCWIILVMVLGVTIQIDVHIHGPAR
jgi:hypothetical protein